MISNYAFAGNQDLKEVITSDSLLSIGEYAFAGCKKLETVTVTAPKVKYGPYAFTGCKSLESFYVNAAVLPEGMFYECEKLKSVTVGPDVNDIGEFAFRDTGVGEFEVLEGSTAYKVQKAKYILSADETRVVAVAPTFKGKFDSSKLGGAKVTEIGKGAFSHNIRITEVNLPSVTVIGNYGLGSSEGITSVNFGKLTSIGEYAFFETGITQLPKFDANTAIGKYAFSFTKLTSVSIPKGMTVAEGVFSECLDLAEVTVGDDVVLGNYAFNVSTDNAFEILNYEEEGERYFYYKFSTALKSLTIGKNVVIGENAFTNAASLEKVTLGENAKIGYMAFYNNCSLKEIDLSKALEIGNYAFSGDVYYICVDDAMAYAAVDKEGHYIYSYHAPVIESINLAKAESIGEYAFAYCRSMTDVKLNSAITEIPQYAFAGCIALENIDLSKIVTLGDYAFIENGALKKVDLSSAETVGQYAFVYCKALEDVKLNAAGCDIKEAAFSYCESLAKVKNTAGITGAGPYAFAYTAITEMDLSGAERIEDFAFLKEELTPFKVTLGGALTELGDNPFALCALEPFRLTESTDFNGEGYKNDVYTYAISDKVFVDNGSLYCHTVAGPELIVYAGTDHTDAKIAEGTVRITAYAFAGSDVQMITLPYSTTSVGHKAFYGCENLETVVFGSYQAPILEEEFDTVYYESLEHIPGSGDFGTYEDYSGNEVQINGMGLLPYFMWNSTDGMYSNVFYGANFVDYVGYVEDKLTMVRPVNGKGYDSFIYRQYFDLVIDGAAGADDVTLAAIAAINAIPERVTYEDRALVEAAREAYAKIATTLQQALVFNYADLISAEQRITALTPEEEIVEEPGDEDTGLGIGLTVGIAAAALYVIGAAALLLSLICC